MSLPAHRSARRDARPLLTDGKVVRAILEHLGLSATALTLALARAPPELEFAG
ncbi:MAG: hypothetical protein HOP15_10550 [Planctomycetes bacterium]|nr:hypothetical protein [Planctomycetota bacterium]